MSIVRSQHHGMWGPSCCLGLTEPIFKCSLHRQWTNGTHKCVPYIDDSFFSVLYSVFKVQYFLTAHVALTVYHYFSKLICKQPQVICKVSLPKLFKLLCYFMMQSALRLTIFNRVTSWRWGDSNSWPPACKAGALPTELHPRLTN